MNILTEILLQAERTPNAAAIVQFGRGSGCSFDEEILCSYRTLVEQAQGLCTRILRRVAADAQVGVVMGNSAEWVLADLALMLAGCTQVPVPLAFSAPQAGWLLQNCAVVLTDASGAMRLQEWLETGLDLPRNTMHVVFGHYQQQSAAAPTSRAALSGPDRIVKVVHTSGTTFRPKGVRIRRDGLDALVSALWQRASKDDYRRYLSLVPFSLLIEQVTAIYLPLTSGGALLLPPADMLPLGSPGVIAADRLEIIRAARASALTLTPALVEALAAQAIRLAGRADALHALFGRPTAPLLAAGGAPVANQTLTTLDQLGIPVYQGYGLSENSSVATWNHRGANRIGTVGQPLPHVEVRVADDGELCLRSTSLFAGYSNDDPSSCIVDDDGWLHTGDLATRDSEGFVTITGRKKTLIITANGRNVSPEWLESAYRSVPGVLHVIVYGDDRQFLGGIFVVADRSRADEIRLAIADYARRHLSEIEHIHTPLLIEHSPDVMAQLFTVTGRPRRDAIAPFLSLQKDPSVHEHP
ncbi:AMP-binding protein [Paraburkholderia humisilvae]|uniref:2-succinylbenzoate--CoA ligase n=1 Tax=Paraburkholderia humisilvae TaxID=627669 RepID=A0A6J5D0P9_9BURK|nr:AMP-binding protein [Paraburkholderia humisilvae]CAB3746814.1 2-succinylbenzoate--CoA ligase [Paraburkholderia humisilvae]